MNENKCTLSDEQLIQKCNEWVTSLASNGGKTWCLSVPVNFNKDPDMLFCELIDRFKAKIAQPSASLKEQIEAKYPYGEVNNLFKEPNIGLTLKLHEAAYFGASVVSGVDWEMLEIEFEKYWFGQNPTSTESFQWFKDRLQGVKVEVKPTPVEQSEALSAEDLEAKIAYGIWSIAYEKCTPDDVEHVRQLFKQYVSSHTTKSDAEYNRLLELHMEYVLKDIGGGKSNKMDYWQEYLKDNGLIG